MAAQAAVPSTSLLATLLRRTLPSFKNGILPNTRLVGIDVTQTHISLAISDRSQQTAVPFGILARTAKPSADALILHSAFQHAANHDPKADLAISGIVVGVSPDTNAPHPEYIDTLISGSDQKGPFFPDLAAVLFYSEAHALTRALHAYDDFLDSVHLLPRNLESRKLKRFAAAMDPKIPPEELQTGPAATAHTSTSDILQAVLDDMKQQETR